MRVLVTGATGLLGTDLCRFLAGRHEVVGWARGITHKAQIGHWVTRTVDVTQKSAVETALRHIRPSVVVHAAGMTDVDGCEREPEAAWEANVEASGLVAAACAAAEASLVAVSTDYVFDGEAGRPYREEDAPRPVSHYGRTKLEGERRVLEACPRTVVVRVSGLFGSARANFVSSAVERLQAGQKVPVVTDQVNSPSYAADLARGIGRLLDRLEREPAAAGPQGPLHGPLHLANAGGATRFEVAQVLADWVGASRDLLEKTTWAALNRPARRPPRSELNCGRFARLMGEELRPWREAVLDFVETELKVCHG